LAIDSVPSLPFPRTTLAYFGYAPCGLAKGQPAALDSARNEARERFSRGLNLFENGDNGGALAEFKRANELIPNRLVLFNIGLVYAAMDRPLEAAGTLEKVIKDAGHRLG
jgi:tetratricopeptide (TPR) repeat protein